MPHILPPYTLPLLRNQLPVLQRSRIIDDVDAYRVHTRTSENLCPNPSATVDTSFWNAVNGTLTRETSITNSAPGAFRITANASSVNYGIESDFIPAKQGELWRLSGMCYPGPDMLNKQVSVAVTYYDINKSPIEEHVKGSATMPAVAAWTAVPGTSLQLDFFIPSRGQTAFVKVEFQGPSGLALTSDDWYLIDDIEITRTGTFLGPCITALEGEALMLYSRDGTLFMKSNGTMFQDSDTTWSVQASDAFIQADDDVSITATDDLLLNYNNLFFNGLEVGAWSTYAPTIDQGATSNIAHTVTWAEWMRIGTTVFFQFNLVVTGTGTAGSPIFVDLPVTASVGTTRHVGHGFIFDGSGGAATSYHGTWQMASTTQIGMITHASNNYVGAGPSFALANNDQLTCSGFYRAA